MEWMEVLPPELLVKIFSHYIETEGRIEFLKNLVPVCKAWKELSSSPLLWRTIGGEETWDSIKRFSKRGLLYHTRDLHLPGYHRQPLKVSVALSHIHELKTLDMSINIINRNTMTQVARYCPTLQKLVLQSVHAIGYRRVALYELYPLLSACGGTLKHLNLSYIHSSETEQLITVVADVCSSLEKFQFLNLDFDMASVNTRFPVQKLKSGCQRLQELEFSGCNVVSQSDCIGFSNMKKFIARRCNFHGLDLYSLLKNSTALEYLQVSFSQNIIIQDLWQIPTNRLRVLDVALDHQNVNLGALEQAVHKWKHTMVELHIRGWNGNVTGVLEILLKNNPNPKFKSLLIEMGHVDFHFFKTFVQKCPKLSNLVVPQKMCGALSPYFKTREEVEKILQLPSEEVGDVHFQRRDMMNVQ